mmetsp:Transcript_61745/g.169901  ORF Transcript_61745/g.169901 Transcript_61745/m.169901 type:complete len:250 (-) Transcript_61745:349-1098(-)
MLTSSARRRKTRATPLPTPAKCATSRGAPALSNDTVSMRRNSQMIKNSTTRRHSSSRALIRESIETVKRPKTAPDAPRLIVFPGSRRREAMLAHTPQKRYATTMPRQPRSSSTLRPKSSSRKALPYRCALLAWQNTETSGRKRLGVAFMMFIRKMLSATKVKNVATMSAYVAVMCWSPERSRPPPGRNAWRERRHVGASISRNAREFSRGRCRIIESSSSCRRHAGASSWYAAPPGMPCGRLKSAVDLS